MKTWITKSGYRIIMVLSGRSNVFLLTNGVKNILIDTSTAFMWHVLQKRLNKINVDRIDYLILTHAHVDHAANAHKIKEKYKALVIIHKNEASYLESGNNILPDGTNFFTRALMHLLAKLLAPGIRYEPCQHDFLVNEIFDLNDFGFNAYIMHTPGHTSGSLSVVIDNEIALVGDAMFGIFRWSVFPPFAEDIGQMIHSWGKLLETNCSVFIPSHGTANKRSVVQKDYDRRIKIE